MKLAAKEDGNGGVHAESPLKPTSNLIKFGQIRNKSKILGKEVSVTYLSIVSIDGLSDCHFVSRNVCTKFSDRLTPTVRRDRELFNFEVSPLAIIKYQ